MKKHILPIVSLLGYLASANPSMAQNSATLPEYQLPMTMGPVMRPQNASSSTMQMVTGPSGASENLYIHSWDVGTTQYNGIAWRRTDAIGNLIAEDHIILDYASDIDAVIYQDGSDFFVLAAYYFRDGFSTPGHYYDIYRFEPGGLMPVSTMNYLTSSPVFGRINVDATYAGMAIIWCVPGTGIFTKVADLPGSGFGPDVLLPGTANSTDPDVCVRRGAGGSGTGLDLQLTFLENNLTVVREYRVPFYDILAGSTAGYVQEFTALSVGPKYFPPRIDCPDKWGGGQRWAIAMGASTYSGGVVTQWISAAVKNEDWPGVAPSWTYPTMVDISYVSYPVTWPEPCDPVIAYRSDAEMITVGWISQQNTWVLPGMDKKYLSMDIKDNGGAAPATIPGSFNMISNVSGGNEAVLAFSGQNLHSDFDGLHVAFSQSHPSFPNYCMNYKSRPASASTFSDKKELNLGQKVNGQISISPNPFNNAISFVVPAEGNYTISLTSLDGRMVYSHKDKLTEGQLFQVSCQDWAAGNYMIHITSPENNINKKEKLVKL